jgi:hypothetical protein
MVFWWEVGFGFTQRVRDTERRLLQCRVQEYRLFIPGVGQSRLDYFEKVVGIEGFN